MTETSMDHRDASAVTLADTRIRRIVAVLVVAALAMVLQPLVAPSRDTQALRQASVALAAHRFTESVELAKSVLGRNPESRQALLIAGYALAGLHDDQGSLDYLNRVPDDGSGAAVVALYGRGIRLFGMGHLSAAEAAMRRVLAYDARHDDGHEQLGMMLQMEGRTWESLPHLFEVVRAGHFSIANLQEMSDTEMIWRSNHEFEDICLAAVPSDPLPLLGRARKAMLINETASALQMFHDITKLRPDELQSQARLGRLLLESDDDFLAWHGALPPSADDHPEIWFTRGLWCNQHGQRSAAARCFQETLDRHPEHIAAIHQLGLILAELGRDDEAAMFASRATRLNEIKNLLHGMGVGDETHRRFATLLESLDRNWEAAGSYYVALCANPKNLWARDGLKRVDGRLSDTRCSPWEDVIAKLEFPDSPSPNWDVPRSAGPTVISVAPRPCRVVFEEVSAEAGIQFQYHNGADPRGKQAYMFEYSGGGVAVLDYDADGWPDLYFTQGCQWPLDATQSTYRDRLFRNTGSGQFVDVTDAAGLGDNGLSHGVTTGDFNSDGQPDLYVANVGSNRFYMNNGDGTFRDITAETETTCDVWSSSCVMADFSGDGLADLYVVNYLTGPYECQTDNRPTECGPMSFTAEQDRLFLNLGDGRFRDVTQTSGVAVEGGKGLGVVAADFDGSGKVSLFVANDTTSNFYFTNRTVGPGQDLRFEENALYRGLACDEMGRTQSCMGVAAGDANGDGRLDLFVTNFTREANAFYVQGDDCSFVDHIKKAALLDAGFNRMGWGTQFLDGDLDGRADLVVANGHLNQYSKEKMQPQFFHNVGEGRFTEASVDGLGDYFQRPCLGRAVARLDWNRDGLEDFCATHVDMPAALLANRTKEHGRYLAIHLRGVRSAVDAIGTSVQVTAGEQTWTKQLTAGDGFYASNQRLLIFGLGDVEQVDAVRVKWPSGEVQRFENVAANSEVVLIEGRGEAVRLDKRK